MAELRATDNQMDFQIPYASVIKCEYGPNARNIVPKMEAVLHVIIYFQRLAISLSAPFQLQINNSGVIM